MEFSSVKSLSNEASYGIRYSLNMTIRSTLLFLAYIYSAFGAIPQIKLCDSEDCPTVSRMGVGALHLGDSISGLTTVDDVQAWIEKAYSLGITLFDLADVYPVKGGDSGSSAELFGAALAKTGLRDKIFIVGKMGIVFPSAVDTSRAHLQSTLDWYLKVLNTDHIDLLLIHYSNSFMNATEVAEFFVDMKAAGKVGLTPPSHTVTLHYHHPNTPSDMSAYMHALLSRHIPTAGASLWRIQPLPLQVQPPPEGIRCY